MSMTIAARQQRLRENLERLPAKALEMRTLEDEIAEDEHALSVWASTQKSRAQRPVTPEPAAFTHPDDLPEPPLVLTESDPPIGLYAAIEVDGLPNGAASQ